MYYLGIISPTQFGAVADGASHSLATRYETLEAAQIDYPFATSLGQEIDFCACKAASNMAFGPDGDEHGTNAYLNNCLFIQAGSYWFGNDTWLIRNLASGIISGAGKLSTELRGNVTPLAFDGVWYSQISNLSIRAVSNNAIVALDIDGNVPGHPYTTRGVQAFTLLNILVDGGNSTYAMSMCRQGGSGAQGSECLFQNVHLQSASFACYYQNGFNALANTFMGGNIQGYSTNGIYVVGGTVAVINTGFQSTTGYKQVENDGWDINVGDAGANEACIIYGCRTESLRFLRNAGAVVTDVRAVRGRPSVSGWFANTPYGPAAPQYKAIVEVATDGNSYLYVATVPGVSGVGKPLFPVTGTVLDNTITWTQTPFDFISVIATGSAFVDPVTVVSTAGTNSAGQGIVAITKNADFTLSLLHEMIAVDASKWPVTITLPSMPPAMRGKQFTIKKTDTSINEVMVNSGPAEMVLVIPGGSRGSLTLCYADGAVGGPAEWLIVAKV